jgi:hypothetical protein
MIIVVSIVMTIIRRPRSIGMPPNPGGPATNNNNKDAYAGTREVLHMEESHWYSLTQTKPILVSSPDMYPWGTG